jgi:hypothetical protein
VAAGASCSASFARRSSMGSRPCANKARASAASSRAVASVISEAAPSPISRRRLDRSQANTHFREPLLSMRSQSPPPSPCQPDALIVSTRRALSLCIARDIRILLRPSIGFSPGPSGFCSNPDPSADRLSPGFRPGFRPGLSRGLMRSVPNRCDPHNPIGLRKAVVLQGL